PRAAFTVDNTLTGDGKFGVGLTFKSMEDFSPGQVAKNVPALAKLLEARQQLNDLMLYMDGKDGAQDLLDKVLKDPELMKALAAAKPAA
ncbi:type VI secretion system contractile sheath small subunit, partial [Escherichia coli]|uniref:type VI secretion system contractile sheath small subunit n=1 Tax=Escherichia coli TaxID=562 RepID=UPI0028DFEE24